THERGTSHPEARRVSEGHLIPRSHVGLPSHSPFEVVMPVGRTLLALFLFAAVSVAADLRTLDGKTISGDVMQLTDKEIVLRSAGKEVVTPIEQVLVLELGAAAPAKLTGVKFLDVELTDGSLLHCSQVSFKGK